MNSTEYHPLRSFNMSIPIEELRGQSATDKLASFASGLRSWNRDCTGREPSMSLLQRGADEAADVIEALHSGLTEALRIVNENPTGADVLTMMRISATVRDSLTTANGAVT